MKDRRKQDNDFIDISKLSPVNKLAVSVNGKEVDFKIGDKIQWPEDSQFIKTIVSISIYEDGAVYYQVKWFDGTEIKSEKLSLSDMKLLNINSVSSSEVGFH